MDSLVILFVGQPESSFLRKLFYVDTLHRLRMGSLEYSEFIESLPCFARAQLFFYDAIFPADEKTALQVAAEFLREHKISVDFEQHIVLLDLSFYPLDKNWLSHTLLKACDTDIPLLLYAGSGRNTRFAGLSVRGSCMTHGRVGEEKTSCSVTAEVLADLLDSHTVLRLFSSNFSVRHFNSIKISNNVYFLKWSDQIEKMRAEHLFLQTVPSQVRPYFPHVGEFIERNGGAGYEIEIIPLVDVSKALLNGLFSQNANRRRFLEAVEQYLNTCPRRTVTCEDYQRVCTKIFVEKTRQRIEKMRALPTKKTMDHTCRLNGWESLEEFSNFAIGCLERAIASDSTNVLYFSHGDLFFANMLFDPLGGTLKLIDPRGSNDNSVTSTELPLWYDLAKLSHSFLGHYDLMVHGLIEIVMEEDLLLSLKSAEVSGLPALGDCFVSMLHRMRVPVEKVRLYEGALFLSMIPLHSDSSLRMQRQLVRAMELFRKYGEC